ncbi:G-protein coupled receptor Mth-like [Drosophila ficusphila]|uniref:G-protein coupled receptor Mth-like n=1 Tax=Drosophila ficusphila TaxID=30025 RepID=UPI001C89F783|nr:G-protein coupled receptor Mth-like [Drosophila ficusphila]
MRLPRIWLATVLFVMIQSSSAEIIDCDFFDTVSLSAEQRLSDGSYSYNDVIIPANLTGTYDFRILPDGRRENVAIHIRGCICKVKTCIRFCCPPDHLFVDSQCFKNNMTEVELDPFLNVTLNDGSVVKKHFADDVFAQWDIPIPCDSIFYLDNRQETDQYNLFENGTFLRHYDNMFMDKRDYCLQHFPLEDENNIKFLKVTPFNCFYEESSKTGQTVVVISSQICIVLTITVYLIVKPLMNIQGKCFVCYLFCLFMSYLFLLLELWRFSDEFCVAAGFISYFFIMAAFSWLSVISLNLWRSSSFRSEPLHLLRNYSFSAWGIAMILTGATLLAFKFVTNEDWNPRVGHQYHCWIYTKDWSALLYFFGPIQLLVTLNTIFFILTAKRVIMVTGELMNNSEKQNFIFFFRVFIVMGLSWSLEIFSYLVQNNNNWADIFLVADYFNWSQGILIFGLLILKGSTLKLLKKR